MRRRNMMTGLDMEQHSQIFLGHPEPCIGTNFLYPDNPPVNIVPHLEAPSLQEPYDNNSMFYGPPQQYHLQRASNLGSAMSTAPNFYPPYVNYEAPPSYMLSPGSYGAVVGATSAEHERNPHFMDQGYKRKSSEGMPGNSQYPLAAPCSFPQLNSQEAAPISFPQFGSYPQPLDQGSVRNIAGAATMDPLLSHGHNNFIQGNYAAHPFLPPGSTWYEQHCNSSRSDGSSSHWSQAPPAPYMPGNVVPGSIDSGNVCFPRYHETSSSRNPTPPSVYPRNHYISNHPVPPPPIVYPHMPSASYTETMHATSYTHMGPVQSTGFRINQQHPREDYVPGAILRHHGFPHLRAIPTDEVALWEAGEFYNDDDYVDDHQAMRLDIEDMSYEELLALSDQIGTVKTGLSEEDVKDLLKRKTSLATRINLEEAPSTDLESDSCTICQENYKHQDKIATLDCKHEYHTECLQKWLVIKNVCPICKSEALVMEKKKKLRLSSIGEEVTADSN
ncbi:PREDICTED: probable E3 ubiquitin-protein ligase HIP1 [Camelina sativa]|uniref:RING-type E3 ubiquitin transferase n=1 Tax=Camelina sativa TaxID=90675 RepID=A0ABM0XKJ1_CAMSA|nr:PREDICTED: probable E3 ubiquitin-protein ligase HIP1 [Camelina sativa]